jgi:hypothetical protein
MSTFLGTRGTGRELLAGGPDLELWFAQRYARRERTRAELEELVDELAGRPGLWRDLVEHSPVERLYSRLHLDANLEVWLICWSRLQDTGFHDHNGSRGAVTVVDGALAERRLAIGRPTAPSIVYGTGSTFSFDGSHIHDVTQTGVRNATSIHAYSPALGPMGFYEITPGGLLARRAGDASEEFC